MNLNGLFMENIMACPEEVFIPIPIINYIHQNRLLLLSSFSRRNSATGFAMLKEVRRKFGDDCWPLSFNNFIFCCFEGAIGAIVVGQFSVLIVHWRLWYEGPMHPMNEWWDNINQFIKSCPHEIIRKLKYYNKILLNWFHVKIYSPKCVSLSKSKKCSPKCVSLSKKMFAKMCFTF